jgi:hypothetical protein
LRNARAELKYGAMPGTFDAIVINDNNDNLERGVRRF